MEQLSNHNDALIEEMNGLIEENRVLQETLADQIKLEEEAIKKQNALRKEAYKMGLLFHPSELDELEKK